MNLKTASNGILVILGAAMLWSLAPERESRLNPSATPAYLPRPDDSFAFYLQENRRRIRAALEQYYFDEEDNPFGANYGLNQVLEMRSPFELMPEADHCATSDARVRGFLLVHGLTDSPYLLRSLADSLAALYPCALIRGLLSPGHGTIPGDLQTVTLAQWTATFAWGVESLATEVDELMVVGYSNGSALALDYLQQERDFQPIDRLVLISPGLESTNDNAYLSAYLQYVWPWVYRRGDRDAVKYESFPSNAGAVFHALTRRVMQRPMVNNQVPTLMIVSADDDTTRSEVAIDFFCQRLESADNALLLYRTPRSSSSAQAACAAVEIRSVEPAQSRFHSFSHVALTLPMGDPHYGIDGNYAVCLLHEDFPERLRECIAADGEAIYAENNYVDGNGRVEGVIVRRASFNPDYDGMVERIRCFIEADCASIPAPSSIVP